MYNSAAKNPLIKQGWLRALLFCAFYFLLVLLSSPLVDKLIALMGQQDAQKAAASGANEASGGQFLWLTALVILVISLLTVYAFRQFVDKKSFNSLGFGVTGYVPDALTGLFLGPALLGLGSLLLYVSKHLQWTDITFDGNDLFISFGIILIIALAEEIVFRGYVLNNLLASFGKWVALILSAIVFAAFHFNNPDIGTLSFINLFLGGVLLGINYIYTKNLWFAILLHLGWDFFQGPVLGYKVSGIGFSPVLQIETTGNPLVTGGAFGFEGSVLLTALLVFAILLLAWVYERKFNTQLPAPALPVYK